MLNLLPTVIIFGVVTLNADVCYLHCLFFHLNNSQLSLFDENTRQLSYRKEDRAMRPIYGCTEKF